MRKPNLILVGNKPPVKRKLASIIDSFDFVVRVNRMNYLGPAGTKTDGVFYEPNWQLNNVYHGGENKDELSKINQLFMREHWYNAFNNWSDYISQEQYDTIEVINESYAIEAAKYEKLTSSIKVLGHLLNSHWNEKYNIHITCLDIENRAYLLDNEPTWIYHKGGGKAEQEYLINQIKLKNIIRIHEE